MKTTRKFHIPSDAEDAVLTQAAEADADNPPLTENQLDGLRPALEALSALVGTDAAGELLNRPTCAATVGPLTPPDDVERADVVAIGRARIPPAGGQSWESWFSGEAVTSDFMSARGDPGDHECVTNKTVARQCRKT